MKISETKETYTLKGKVAIPFKYTAGRTGSRFLIGLRDNRKFMGTKCPTCNKVYVPPRSTCKDCFAQLNEWVDVSDKGTLLNYTVVHHAHVAQPVQPPFAYGIVQLDGADTGFVHMLGEVDFDRLEIGMRVQAVFNDERTASVLDIKHFKPIDK